MRKPPIGLLCAALLVVATTAAAATPERTATEVSQLVMSPFCPGVTLHDCASGQALRLRDRITTWAEQGWSRERILNELVAEYGPAVLAVPPGDSGIPIWLVPALAVVAGAGLWMGLARRWARTPSTGEPAPVSPEDRARLDAALRATRGER